MKKIILCVISMIFSCTSYFNVNNNDIKNTNYIIIDKVFLNQEIKSYNESNVDHDIIYLKETNFNNNFYILAAHSGNSKIAYFKNLYKLKKNDKVILNINNKKMVFKVNKIYYQEKTGKIHLKKNINNTLILTTCDRFNQKRQLIIECIM